MHAFRTAGIKAHEEADRRFSVNQRAVVLLPMAMP